MILNVLLLKYTSLTVNILDTVSKYFGFNPCCEIYVIYRVLCIDYIICLISEGILFVAAFVVWFCFSRYENFQRRLTQNPLFWKT